MRDFVRGTVVVMESPVTLGFAALAVALFALNWLTMGTSITMALAAAPRHYGLLKWSFWTRVVTYPLVRVSLACLLLDLCPPLRWPEPFSAVAAVSLRQAWTTPCCSGS
jgi:hypothetical protein